MSAFERAAAALIAILEEERAAPAGSEPRYAAAKRAGLEALEAAIRADPANAERATLEGLLLAASRNGAVLEARADAARALVRDLGQRLIEADADGVYSRAELLAPSRPGEALAPRSEGDVA